MNISQNEVAFQIDQTGQQVMSKFIEFLSNYKIEKEPVHEQIDVYGEQAHEMVVNNRHTMFVSLKHLKEFDGALAQLIDEEYYQYEIYLIKGLQQFMFKYQHRNDNIQYKLSFYSKTDIDRIRDMNSEKIGKLLSISGTITRSTEVRPELIQGTFECPQCNHIIKGIQQQFKYTEPKICGNIQCNNRNDWKLEISDSLFSNFQKLRVQENSEEIPAGSMPRSIDVIIRDSMVEKFSPGEQCIFVGMLTAVPQIISLLKPGERSQVNVRSMDAQRRNNSIPMDGVTGLKQLGVRDLQYKLVFQAGFIQNVNKKYHDYELNRQNEDYFEQKQRKAGLMNRNELETVEKMLTVNNIYDRLAESLAPGVNGHLEIKKGILLQLMGGVHKKSIDNSNIRGDLNIMVCGDPSTAKSQFLKYVSSFCPRSVYTSGKASTAAGLTASVRRDQESGELCIEAGALMLADNSVCCIDEFDKMDDKDQVAIHEAMEQQTISLSKAGIHTTLNARTSILAAANPRQGRYDKSRSLNYNLNISAPILSRFDLFYVVLDENNTNHDRILAEYIVNMHRLKEQAIRPYFTKDQLTHYINYMKNMIQPYFTREAADELRKAYVYIRLDDQTQAQQNSYRITVRQLESLVRLSEALARVHGNKKIIKDYVQEARRLLVNSILKLDREDIDIDEQQPQQMQSVGQLEQPRQPATNVIKITYEQFRSISKHIIHFVKEKTNLLREEFEKKPEEQQVDELDEEIGIEQHEIIEKYIDDNEQDVASDQDRKRVYKIVETIISRLINQEQVLKIIEDNQDPNRRKLTLHDNFVS